MLVVEAFSAGTAFGWVDLEVDRSGGDVMSAQAAVQTAWADAGAGHTPDQASAFIQAAAEARVAPLVKRVICHRRPVPLRPSRRRRRRVAAGGPGRRCPPRRRPGGPVAFTNRGGLRADLAAGPVAWGDPYAAQPFGNDLVAMTLSGDADPRAARAAVGRIRVPRCMPVSGLTYGWSASASGTRVSDVRVGAGTARPPGQLPRGGNRFLASGGDGFAVLTQRDRSRDRRCNDLEALVAYLKSLPQPLEAPRGGRIRALP